MKMKFKTLTIINPQLHWKTLLRFSGIEKIAPLFFFPITRKTFISRINFTAILEVRNSYKLSIARYVFVLKIKVLENWKEIVNKVLRGKRRKKKVGGRGVNGVQLLNFENSKFCPHQSIWTKRVSRLIILLIFTTWPEKSRGLLFLSLSLSLRVQTFAK